MGLKKQIELDNGIIVNYHRIVSLNKITNSSNVVEVASYTSKSKRDEEIASLKSDEATNVNVFINTQYISKEYEENENIKNAYDFLKTLDQFKDSEDE